MWNIHYRGLFGKARTDYLFTETSPKEYAQKYETRSAFFAVMDLLVYGTEKARERLKYKKHNRGLSHRQLIEYAAYITGQRSYISNPFKWENSRTSEQFENLSIYEDIWEIHPNGRRKSDEDKPNNYSVAEAVKSGVLSFSPSPQAVASEEKTEESPDETKADGPYWDQCLIS